MERLIDDINKKNVIFRNKIYINLFLVVFYMKYMVSIESVFVNCMYIKLKERIREYVKMGIIFVLYIRKMFKSFVDKELSFEDCVLLFSNDRSYFLINRDIRNCVYVVFVKGQYFGLD